MVSVEGSEEAVEGDAEEEGEQDLGDEVAGEEEDTGGGEGGEAGVEGGAGAEGAVGPAVAEECEKKDSDGLGKMRGEGVEAEDAEAKGDEPVGERSFFQVADAVDAEGDEVAGEGHVASGAGVGAVGIIEQWRGEEGCEEEDQPEAAEDDQSEGASRDFGVDRCLAFGGGFEEGVINHEFATLYQHKWVTR